MNSLADPLVMATIKYLFEKNNKNKNTYFFVKTFYYF